MDLKSNICSYPIKEKYSKTPTGKYVVTHERISIVHPKGGKKGGIPVRESPGIANIKRYPSWRQKDLIPTSQRENSNEDLSWRQKEWIPRRQRKQRGIPEKESPGIFSCKWKPSWRQKEVMPRCQWDNSYVVYNSYIDPSWLQNELIPRCQRENFAPTKFEI